MVVGMRQMRQRQLATARIRPVSRSRTIAAPVRGWNARDPYHNMNPLFATILDNWFPDTNYVGLRRGHVQHATGVGAGAVQALHSYRSGATKKLLAAGGGAIYDATAAGAVGAALASGFSSNRWHGVNFNGKALLFNGVDAPQTYDGSTITATGWTGPTDPTKLRSPIVFKERVLAIEDNTADFWYGDIDAITGAMTKFPLGAVYSGGGPLRAMGTFTVDAGDGPDDYVAFFFDSGDIVVYGGTDPASASTFALVGRFKIGRVIGNRPLQQVGSDLIGITADGYMPIEQFIRAGRQNKRLAISDNISRAVNDAVRSFADNDGWQLALYPRGNMLIANVPLVEDQQAVQHVQNTLTGAWCRFTGLPAVSWEVHDDVPYFGTTGGIVCQFDQGNNDGGSNIDGDAQSAFVYFGGNEWQKQFKMYRALLTVDAPLTLNIGLGVDFAENILTTIASAAASEGAEWDVADWDVADWAGGFGNERDWQVADQIGVAAAVRIKTSTDGINARWFATQVAYEQGGIL